MLLGSGFGSLGFMRFKVCCFALRVTGLAYDCSRVWPSCWVDAEQEHYRKDAGIMEVR